MNYLEDRLLNIKFCLYKDYLKLNKPIKDLAIKVDEVDFIYEFSLKLSHSKHKNVKFKMASYDVYLIKNYQTISKQHSAIMLQTKSIKEYMSCIFEEEKNYFDNLIKIELLE